MALLTTISAMNRVDEQGATWEYEITPIGTYTAQSGGSNVTRYQWRCNVTMTRTYRYVGLTRSAAESAAETISAAYKMTLTKKTTRWDSSSKRWIITEVQNIEQEQVQATPRMTDGNVWEVAVSVIATNSGILDTVLSSKPTIASLKAFLSSVANYPELSTNA